MGEVKGLIKFDRQDSNKQSVAERLKHFKEFTLENDKNESLFNLFMNTLYKIAGKDDPAVSMLAFKVRMLTLLGYMPEMNRCVVCEAKMSSNKIAFFSALEGGLHCQNCKRNTGGLVKISGGAIANINYLADQAFQKIERLTIQSSLQDEIRKLLRYYISFLLSKELKMWRYL